MLMVKMMKRIVNLGGSIGAEHGLGKKTFNKKKAIFYQFKENDINEIRTMKRILDPNNIKDV